MSELAEDSRFQCMEFASPVLANFASKECGETPEPQVLNEIVEDSRLQCIEFTSPAHTILPDKTGAENFASPSFDVVAKDSKRPSLEFTSPAHTVATFQPYADGIPTPKFTASVSFHFFHDLCLKFVFGNIVVPEVNNNYVVKAAHICTFHSFQERNFLLSVLELTSPGSRPETSQQPSCKRALLNSL